MSDNPFHDSPLGVTSTHPLSHPLSHAQPHAHSHSHALTHHSLPLPPHSHSHPLSHSHHPLLHSHAHSHGQHNEPTTLTHHHQVDSHHQQHQQQQQQQQQQGGNDLSVANALRQMSEPDGYPDLVHMPISKRLVEEVLASTGSSFDVDLNADGSPDRKRRKTNGEQQIKRHKYDVLKAFFRLYFEVDKESMVLKDAIHNLYARKIPSEARIARNAMYRHMRSFFKDKTTTFQSNYREYVKGIKLVMSQNQISYDGYDKDMELLTSVGVTDLFDFQEEELAKTDKISGVGSPYLSSEESLFNYIDQIEQVHKNLGNMLKELKNRIKKKT